MTYFEAEREAVSALKTNGIPDPDIDAELLLTHAGGFRRAVLLAERNNTIPEPVLAHFRQLIERRCRREPLQYILGSWEFMGLEFEVSPACLIPRQDTELLVLKAYDAFCHICSNKKKIRVLDICTGSGCVIISLAHLIMSDFMKASDREQPVSISFEGTDISTEALKVAVSNASRHGADIHFHISDMFETLDCEGQAYDIITANPPYIETAAIKKLNPELWKYEPMLALDGGEDGLVPYRLIAVQAASHLKSGGILLMEIGDTQGQQVKTLMEEAGFENVTVHKDLAGLDRVVTCNKIEIRVF